MSNIIRTATELSFHIIKSCIGAGCAAVDATCGNGRDTLRLARMNPSILYAFDIQREAVENTGALLAENGFSDSIRRGSIRLIHDSHENMGYYIDRPVDCVVFNLGYLPGGDKDITTARASSLAAAKTALSLLRAGGVLCVTVYSGHDEGKREKEAFLEWSSSLDPAVFHSVRISMNNQKNDPPEILLITRKKDM